MSRHEHLAGSSCFWVLAKGGSVSIRVKSCWCCGEPALDPATTACATCDGVTVSHAFVFVLTGEAVKHCGVHCNIYKDAILLATEPAGRTGVMSEPSYSGICAVCGGSAGSCACLSVREDEGSRT